MYPVNSAVCISLDVWQERDWCCSLILIQLIKKNSIADNQNVSFPFRPFNRNIPFRGCRDFFVGPSSEATFVKKIPFQHFLPVTVNQFARSALCLLLGKSEEITSQ